MTGYEIRDARLAMRLSQVDMARMLGITPSHLCRVEACHYELGETTMRLFRAYVEGYRPKDWPAM